MKRIIRLTESDFHRLVKESTKRILNEMLYGDEEITKTPFDMGFDQNKDDINTKEGYIKFLLLKLIRDGINPKEAVDKAFEEANKRFQ